MKKIFLYTPSLQPGGVYSSNRLLAEGFSRKGYKVKIITNRKTDLNIEGFEHIYLNAGDFVRPFKLKNLILKEKPLAVFSNLQTQNISLALAKLLIRDKSLNTKFFGFIRTTDASIKYNSKIHYPYRFLVRKLYERLDKIIAVSSLSKKDIEKTFQIDEKKIVVINDPVDLELIYTLQNEKLDEKEEKIFSNKTLIYVGRFAQQKRVDLLLRIFKNLENEYKDINIVLVGKGELEQQIKVLAKKLNLKNVYFFPFTLNPFKYMKKSYLLLLTSFEEGLGRVVIEAFACGTPVVAFENEFSGHKDIINDGKNGFLVPFGNIDLFVEKVKILLNNETLRKEFSKNAKEKVKDFEVKKVISKLEKLIYT
jgi:glycosyltransferase involved in cell wall biosynthesis